MKSKTPCNHSYLHNVNQSSILNVSVVAGEVNNVHWYKLKEILSPPRCITNAEMLFSIQVLGEIIGNHGNYIKRTPLILNWMEMIFFDDANAQIENDSDKTRLLVFNILTISWLVRLTAGPGEIKKMQACAAHIIDFLINEVNIRSAWNSNKSLTDIMVSFSLKSVKIFC